MKLLYLLPCVFLIACSSHKSEPLVAPVAPTVTVIGEEVTTTGRYFAFVPTPSILIFSETRNWRHEEGIAGATLAIMKAAKEMGYGYFTTENSGIFNEKDLARFNVVVFNNMTGDALTPEQEMVFAEWQAKGNGTVLIHGAGDASHQDWDFYHNELLGATFVSHPAAPQFQEARVEILAPSHPIMVGMPKDFMAIDEWYTYEAPPSDDFILLAGLDESTYSPLNTVYGDVSDLRMGPKTSDHPIIWARCLGDNQARSVFTAMGHRYETYETPEALLILKNSLNWAAKITDPQSVGCAK
jgi:type 1 glutamine amidotransferase